GREPARKSPLLGRRVRWQRPSSSSWLNVPIVYADLLVIVDSHVHLFPPAVAQDRAAYVERDGWFKQLYEPARARIASVADLLHSSEPVGHLYRGKGQNSPDKIYAFALAHPDLKIVAAHWGGGLPFYYLMPEMGPSLPNLYFDSAATELLYDGHVYTAALDA